MGRAVKILITGGCGFVGRRFAARLLAADDNDVLIIDNMQNGIPVEDWLFKPKYPERLVVRQGDCRTYFRMYKFLPHMFDLVIHCAAIVGGRMNIDGDPLAVATNLSIDSELFHWVTREKDFKPKLVYFSSSAVYPLEMQTKEWHISLSESAVMFSGGYFAKPDKTYGFTKLAGEYLADFAAREYGLDVRVFRPFGGYGEDQDMNYPFPSIIRRIVEGENPVIVWGSGKQERDFIYIEDVVSVVLDTLYLKPGTLNVGTGRVMNFSSLAMLACQLLDVPPNIRVVADTSKPEGVYSRVANTAKLRQFWKNPFTPLEEGIRKVAKHVQTKVGLEHEVAQ